MNTRKKIKGKLTSIERCTGAVCKRFRLGDNATTGELFSIFDRVGDEGRSAILFLLWLHTVMAILVTGGNLTEEDLSDSLGKYRGDAHNSTGDGGGGLEDAWGWATDCLDRILGNHITQHPGLQETAPRLRQYRHATLNVGS